MKKKKQQRQQQPPSSRLKRNILYIHVECSDQKNRKKRKNRKILRPQLRRQREKSPEFSLSCWVYVFFLSCFSTCKCILIGTAFAELALARLEIGRIFANGLSQGSKQVRDARCRMVRSIRCVVQRMRLGYELANYYYSLCPPVHILCGSEWARCTQTHTTLARQVIYIDRGRVRNQKISKWIVLGIYGHRARIVNVNEGNFFFFDPYPCSGLLFSAQPNSGTCAGHKRRFILWIINSNYN